VEMVSQTNSGHVHSHACPLDAYGADGEIERVMPGGDQPDLIVIDPLDGQPVTVEFTSRFREARRSALGGHPDEGGAALRVPDDGARETPSRHAPCADHSPR